MSSRSRSHLAVGVLSVTLLSLTGCAASPESTVRNFYIAVEKGEITKAKTYLSAQLVGMIGNDKLSAGLAARSEQVRKCGGVKSIDVALEGQGEVRSGTVTVTFNGGCPPESDKVKLVKEDGKWKMGIEK